MTDFLSTISKVSHTNPEAPFDYLYVSHPFFVLLNDTIYLIVKGTHHVLHTDVNETWVDLSASVYSEGCFDAVDITDACSSLVLYEDNKAKLTVTIPTAALSGAKVVTNLSH